MQLAPTITFRGMAPSAALETNVRKRIQKLDSYYRSMTGCHVTVGRSQRHHARGNRFRVRIELTVPGDTLIVAHEPSVHNATRVLETGKVTKRTDIDPERKHANVAVREAFEVARRQLQDYARRQRGAVKTSSSPPRRPTRAMSS